MTELPHDRSIKRFIRHTVLTDGDDPNQRVALAIMERIHIGIQSREEDELRITADVLTELFLQKLAQWDDPEGLLDAILEQVVARFPEEELAMKPQEPSLFDKHPDSLERATRHRRAGWENEQPVTIEVPKP